jgi:hypothetical protein
VDCSDGSDEMKCNKTRPGKMCKADEFRCTDGSSCIKKGLVCNKHKNCLDGSDEKYCGELSLMKTGWNVLHTNRILLNAVCIL